MKTFVVDYKQVETGKWRYFIADPSGKVLYGPFASRTAVDNKVTRLQEKGWAWAGEGK